MAKKGVIASPKDKKVTILNNSEEVKLKKKRTLVIEGDKMKKKRIMNDEDDELLPIERKSRKLEKKAKEATYVLIIQMILFGLTFAYIRFQLLLFF